MILLQDNFYITLELLRENLLFDTKKFVHSYLSIKLEIFLICPPFQFSLPI